MDRRQGFTLFELMIVIGIILVLVAMFLPTLRLARQQAQRAACMSNIRQVSQAYTAYANDHDGYFLALESGTGQVGFARGGGNGQVIVPLYPYVRDSRVFHCPADPRDNGLSYVPNDIFGSKGTVFAGYANPLPRLLKVANGVTTYEMIEEFDLYPKTKNNPGGFVVPPAPAEPTPTEVWIDTPGIAHGGGSCLTFVDGHCEFWPWGDPQTLAFSAGAHFARTTGDADLARLQAVLGSN